MKPKRHSYELIGAHDDIDTVLSNLSRWFRRQRPKFENDVVEKGPSAYDHLAPGNRFGRYREIIVRREIRRRCAPDWFDAMQPGQFAIIGPDGARCYVEVQLDWDVRDAQRSTFDIQIASCVDPAGEQIGLF